METEEENASKTHWKAHAYTRKLHRAYTKEVETAHKKLLQACSASSDPDVRAAHMNWGNLRTIGKMLEDNNG